jgi:hypothetical protein
VKTGCIAWDITAEDMLAAFGEASWTGGGGGYSIVNVTRKDHHFSVGGGYAWKIIFDESVGDAPSIVVVDGSAEGCTGIAESFTQTGNALSARTILDGFPEREVTIAEDTRNDVASLRMVNLEHSSIYKFSVTASNAVGSGASSEYSAPVATSTVIGCLVQSWSSWSVCEPLLNMKKQCGEYVCRSTSCGRRVCGRRACGSIDVSKINFNINPNATSGFMELDTETFQNRTRYLLLTPENDGASCPSELIERRPCCNSAKTNKVVEIRGKKLVCNGTTYVPHREMPIVEEVAGEELGVKVSGNGDLMASTTSCRL